MAAVFEAGRPQQMSAEEAAVDEEHWQVGLAPGGDAAETSDGGGGGSLRLRCPALLRLFLRFRLHGIFDC